MQKKRERIPKKRGRPRKLKKQKLRQESTADDSLTKSCNGDAHTETLIQPSRPLANASPTVLPTQHEIITPVESTDTPDGTTVSSETERQLILCKNVLNLDKFTSDILAQAQENNELISDHINVEGYKVKRELAPLVKAIFRKYGDICKESTFSVESRSFLLEWVCGIYKKLEASAFLQLTSSEVKSMFGQMKDLEVVKVEIGWLSRRLSQISKAREMFGGVSTIEDVEARTEVVIGEKTKAIESYEKKVKAGMEAVKKLQEKLEQEKDELDVFDEVKKMCGESLVHGLV